MTFEQIYYELQKTQNRYCKKSKKCDNCRFDGFTGCIITEFLEALDGCFDYNLSLKEK